MTSVERMHHVLGAHPGSARLVDAVIAAAALAGSMAQLSHGGIAGIHTGPEELDVLGGGLAAGSSLPLLAWRRSPRAVFAITASAVVLLGALGYPLALALGPAAALFLLTASRDEDDPWKRRDTVTAVGFFGAFLAGSALADSDFPDSELLHTGLVWAVAWFAGERTRLRHEHVAELADRAARTERDAERERLLAVAEERARIARDLHDSAGNAINVIAVRAGTARMRRDPERSQATLEAIEELARRTGAEIDQIVGTLRNRGSGDGVDEPPGLASLDALVARHVASGLRVSVSRDGDASRLAGAADQAAYRILHEALTNAARHGAGDAQVELSFRDTVLEMTVNNPAGETAARTSGGGHGLIGMRERATLLGGSLEVDRANGSFRIHARLPYGGGST